MSSLESVESQLQKFQATNRHIRRFVRPIEHDSEFDQYLTRLNKSLIKLPSWIFKLADAKMVFWNFSLG